MTLAELQTRIVAWHTDRFPEAQIEHVALKVCEEAGELARAVNGFCGSNSATGGGVIPEEAADTCIALLVLLGRWQTNVDLLHEIAVKLLVLETPNAHRASRQS